MDGDLEKAKMHKWTADLESALNFKPFWCITCPNRTKIDQVMIFGVLEGLVTRRKEEDWRADCRQVGRIAPLLAAYLSRAEKCTLKSTVDF